MNYTGALQPWIVMTSTIIKIAILILHSLVRCSSSYPSIRCALPSLLLCVIGRNDKMFCTIRKKSQIMCEAQVSKTDPSAAYKGVRKGEKAERGGVS